MLSNFLRTLCTRLSCATAFYEACKENTVVCTRIDFLIPQPCIKNWSMLTKLVCFA